MDWGYVSAIGMVSALLLLLIQRAEPKRRRLVAIIVVLCLLVIRHNAFLKDDLYEETLLALLLALALNGVFWLLIGRYNPVEAGAAIDVVGMDD